MTRWEYLEISYESRTFGPWFRIIGIGKIDVDSVRERCPGIEFKVNEKENWIELKSPRLWSHGVGIILDALGAEGWELIGSVTALSTGTGTSLLFKRVVQESDVT